MVASFFARPPRSRPPINWPDVARGAMTATGLLAGGGGDGALAVTGATWRTILDARAATGEDGRGLLRQPACLCVGRSVGPDRPKISLFLILWLVPPSDK